MTDEKKSVRMSLTQAQNILIQVQAGVIEGQTLQITHLKQEVEELKRSANRKDYLPKGSLTKGAPA